MTRRSEIDFRRTAESLPQNITKEIEREILISELRERMDDWTRKVFDVLVLGYQYKDMESEFGMKANAIRAEFSRQLAHLLREIEREHREAEARKNAAR